MKNLVLEFSNDLVNFCNEKHYRFKITIIDEYKFIVIQFEENLQPSEIFEIGMLFAEFKNSIKY